MTPLQRELKSASLVAVLPSEGRDAYEDTGQARHRLLKYFFSAVASHLATPIPASQAAQCRCNSSDF